MSQMPNLASSRINQAMRTDTTVGQARAEFTDAEAVSRAARMRLRDARRSRDPAAIAAATLALNEVERQRGAAQNTFADVGRLTRREAVEDRSDADVAQARLRLARQLPGAIADGAGDLRAQTLAAPPLSNNPTIRDVQERRRGQALNLADAQAERAAVLDRNPSALANVFGPVRGAGALNSTADYQRLQSMRQVQRDAAGEIVPTTLGSRAAIGQQEQVAEAETQRRLAALRRQEEVALGERAVAEAGGQGQRRGVGLSREDGAEAVQAQLQDVAASVAEASATIASSPTTPDDAEFRLGMGVQGLDVLRQTTDPELRRVGATTVLAAIADNTNGGLTSLKRTLQQRAAGAGGGAVARDLAEGTLSVVGDLVTGDLSPLSGNSEFANQRAVDRARTSRAAEQMLQVISELERLAREPARN